MNDRERILAYLLAPKETETMSDKERIIALLESLRKIQDYCDYSCMCDNCECVGEVSQMTDEAIATLTPKGLKP